MQKITKKEVGIVSKYLQDNKIHGYPCTCGIVPEIIVERTAWGMPAVILKCRSQKCEDMSTAIADIHINALVKVLNSWNVMRLRMTVGA
jgi:hypothetical protein